MKNIHIIILVLIMALSGCKTIQEVPVEVVKYKTEYIDRYKLDSILIKDSVDRFIKGDTLILYKQKLITRYIVSKDTINTTDSIEKPVYITKTVTTNKMNKFQSWLFYIGLSTILYGIYQLIKLIIKIKNNISL